MPLSKMKSLIDTRKPYGEIVFVHFRDGTTHKFWTAVNKLTGERLSAFDNNPPDIGESVAYCKSVFSDIRRKATRVISYEGSKQFA